MSPARQRFTLRVTCRRVAMRFSVRGGEEAAQARRQLELEHRNCFLQPFPETGRGGGMTVGLEPTRQGLQLAAGGPPRSQRDTPDAEPRARRARSEERR